MPYARKEDKATQMRDYRRRQKDKHEEDQITLRIVKSVLIEQLTTQAISDMQQWMFSNVRREKLPEIPHYPFSKRKTKFLKPVVEAVIKQYPTLTGADHRELIENIVYNRWEQAKRYPEERKYSTFSAREVFVINELKPIHEEVEEAEEWVSACSTGWPKKEQLYPKGRIERFVTCMNSLKAKGGFSFHAAREACGKKFLSLDEFWDRAWLEKSEPAIIKLARSHYALGSKFWDEADKAGINTRSLWDWREKEKDKLKQIYDLKLELAKGTYATYLANETYEKVARIGISENLNDDQIMSQLDKRGATEFIDPTYFRNKLLPELRKTVQEEFERSLEEQILKYILKGLTDQQIVEYVNQNYNVYEDEVKAHIRTTRMALRNEFDETKKKAWTRCKRKHTYRFKV